MSQHSEIEHATLAHSPDISQQQQKEVQEQFVANGKRAWSTWTKPYKKVVVRKLPARPLGLKQGN
jgi:hypothetical protein